MTPRLLVTVNGPGELMGWARPFVRAVYRLDPSARITLVFVPCPYASGREPDAAQRLFPNAAVVSPKRYARFLMGRATEGMERGAGALQYLGGDLYHANTIAKRLGLVPMTYKFSKRHFAHSFARFFAVDELNAAQLRATNAPADRVRVVGNLVADAVLESLREPAPPPGQGQTLCIFPGSRPPELKALLPFLLDTALRVMRARPGLRGSVVISPFSTDEEIRASLVKPDPAFGGVRGELSADGRTIAAEGMQVDVDRSGSYEALAQAALVIATPGTKCIEAAVLGKPLLVIAPLNSLDEIVLPGMAGYLHRVPLVGRPLKRWVARKIERRFKYMAQPNIDAGKPLVPELRGVLRAEDIAAHAQAMLANPQALHAQGVELAKLYARDVGAATKMAREALDVASDAMGAAAGAAS